MGRRPRETQPDYDTVPFSDIERAMIDVANAYNLPFGEVCRKIGITPSGWSGWKSENDKTPIRQRACYLYALQMLLVMKDPEYRTRAINTHGFTTDDYLFIAKAAKGVGNTELAYKAMEGFLDG